MSVNAHDKLLTGTCGRNVGTACAAQPAGAHAVPHVVLLIEAQALGETETLLLLSTFQCLGEAKDEVSDLPIATLRERLAPPNAALVALLPNWHTRLGASQHCCEH